MIRRRRELALCMFLSVFSMTLPHRGYGQGKEVATKPVHDPSRTKAAASSDFRTWRSGKFTTEARFVELIADQVTLEKRDGKRVSVAMVNLSDADQEFVASQVADGRPALAKVADEKPKDTKSGDKTPRLTKAERDAIRLANQKAEFHKDLVKQLANRPDGYVVLALEEISLANHSLAVAISVSKGREAVADNLTAFWFNGNPTRRSYQILAWFNDSEMSKQVAEAHQRQLAGFISNRMQDAVFDLAPCYSDLQPNSGISINQGIADGTVIRYVPFATANR